MEVAQIEGLAVGELWSSSGRGVGVSVRTTPHPRVLVGCVVCAAPSPPPLCRRPLRMRPVTKPRTPACEKSFGAWCQPAALASREATLVRVQKEYTHAHTQHTHRHQRQHPRLPTHQTLRAHTRPRMPRPHSKPRTRAKGPPRATLRVFLRDPPPPPQRARQTPVEGRQPTPRCCFVGTAGQRWAMPPWVCGRGSRSRRGSGATAPAPRPALAAAECWT